MQQSLQLLHLHVQQPLQQSQEHLQSQQRQPQPQQPTLQTTAHSGGVRMCQSSSVEPASRTRSTSLLPQNARQSIRRVQKLGSSSWAFLADLPPAVMPYSSHMQQHAGRPSTPRPASLPKSSCVTTKECQAGALERRVGASASRSGACAGLPAFATHVEAAARDAAAKQHWSPRVGGPVGRHDVCVSHKEANLGRHGQARFTERPSGHRAPSIARLKWGRLMAPLHRARASRSRRCLGPRSATDLPNQRTRTRACCGATGEAKGQGDEAGPRRQPQRGYSAPPRAPRRSPGRLTCSSTPTWRQWCALA